MLVYKIKTLSELILELKMLPMGAVVRGIDSSYIHSDRGWYERNAVEPNASRDIPAINLAHSLESQIGNIMHGWKGGDFTISGGQPVAFAAEGSTGPYIAGFALAGDEHNLYSPVLIDDRW